MLQKPISQVLRTTKAHLKRLDELGVKTINDFLLFFPRTYEDKRVYTNISNLRTDEINNIKGKISNLFHKKSKFGKHLTKCVLNDDTGSVEVIWFNQPYLKRILRNGMNIILSGKPKYSYGKTALLNPTYEEFKTEQTHTGKIIPIYHQTEGISSKWIREKFSPLIKEWISHTKEHLPLSIREEYKLIKYQDALLQAHFPTDDSLLEKAKKRLSFDELFILQLKALQKKWHWQNIEEHDQKPIPHNKETDTFISNLPFKLTNAQNRTYKEVLNDLNKKFPMSRLVQGDVGSGKTVIAGIAIFNAYKADYQSALMAPTEILAKQHYNTLFKMLQPYGFNIQFVSGSCTKTHRSNIINQLKTGTIDLIIGTHALIQKDIEFNNLGLAIIDEQHRFGVKQRDVLKANGNPHLLSLSATPIPRTLAMTIYGDQDLSIIDELPKGRQEIITRIVPEPKRQDSYRWIENQILKGRQAFIICPLIDESDVLEVKSAIQEHEKLQNEIFPTLNVGLLHGKMKSKDKESIMNEFLENKINILVSTSVIEVGIDVPNASIMLIESSDRFGLSQLHQFRGRVGRGEHQSYCFLFPKTQSEDSKKRLHSMVQHSDGFKLAEIDLEIRGPGEIYGVKQSGIPDLKMASLTDSITIKEARQAAQLLISEDPYLKNYPILQEKLSELEEVHIKD